MEQQPAIQDPLIGLTIGNYVVKQKLGEGGMGSVYLAEHPGIGKKVAVKVLHAEFASNTDVVARFFTEAKAVNDIQHPNIVDIVDYGELLIEDGGQMVYFIMEFLDGEALAHLIRNEAPLAPERALGLCMQIADALGASHQKGIVHRDLKPDNVILIKSRRQGDFVKVLDFGIAKLTGDQPGSRRTRTGIVMGTPAYMSPEQCEGRGNVDHRTDIYALGILLYEMLIGRVPFVGDGYGEVLVQHLTQAPARPSTIRAVSPHVEAVCMKALEKAPENRYPTMEEFMKALADPVGYVESHGGLGGFAGAHLVDTGGPLPAIPQAGRTPSPLSPLTPVPGTLTAQGASPLTPPPGSLSSAANYSPTYTPGPGTLAAAAGQVPTPYPVPQAPKSKVGIYVGLLVAVLAIGGGAFFATRGSGGSDGGAAAPTDTTAANSTDTKPTDMANKPADTADKHLDKPLDKPTDTADTADKPADKPLDKPADPPIKPQPVMVKIEVKSSPKGAEVWVAGESKSRGKTPVTFEMEKADKKLEITLKRSRYKDKKQTISLSGGSTLRLTLSRKRRTSSHGSTSSTGKPVKPRDDKPTGPTDKDGVVSPF